LQPGLNQAPQALGSGMKPPPPGRGVPRPRKLTAGGRALIVDVIADSHSPHGSACA